MTSSVIIMSGLRIIVQIENTKVMVSVMIENQSNNVDR